MPSRVPNNTQSVAKMVNPTPDVVAPEAPTAPATRRNRAPKGATAGVKVRATHVGYYGEARRRIGDVFRLARPEDFSPTWMELASAAETEHTTSGPSHLAAQNAEGIEAKRRPGGPAYDPTGATGDQDPLGDDS